MEDIFLIILLLVVMVVCGISFACAYNEDNAFLVDEYEKILNKEFGQVFDNYEDYVLYKIEDYNLKVEGDY